MEIKNIYGYKKYLFNLKLKLFVLFYYLPNVFRGKIKFGNFLFFIKRLLIFVKKLQHNKFVKINNEVKLDLYVPSFPTKAFYTACNKFLVTGKKMPCTTVLISITSKCIYSCKHCYQRLDKGKDIDIDKLISIVKILQDKGIAFFNIEGGEPFIEYEKLLKLCQSIDDRSEIWINSTGYKITKERLIELKNNNVKAIMFSMHSPNKNKFNEFMGKNNAFEIMENAIKLCHEVGILVSFNSCLMSEDFKNGNFEKIMDIVKIYNAAIIQIIKPKPSGAWLENENLKFDKEDLKQAKKKINKYNLEKEYNDYPTISAQIIEESSEVFGCTAGGTDRFYINAKGDLQPCEFLNISFGNINTDDFESIYTKMRTVFNTPGNFMLCEKYSNKVASLYKEYHLDSLPLDSNISKKVYENWDKGNITELYKKLK
jgi:MoaA/NifB/PqqE/SkfB family radical SAM enzyme